MHNRRRNLSSYIFCLTISEGSCNSSTVCMKLLRDLSVILMISCLNMSCLMSFVYQLFRFLHIGSYASSKFRWSYRYLPICHVYLDLTIFDLRHPVMILQVSFSATETRLLCFNWLHTGKCIIWRRNIIGLIQLYTLCEGVLHIGTQPVF